MTEKEQNIWEQEFLDFYEKRIRPLETQEFIEWWETWYAPESQFVGKGDLYNAYLSERRFALIAWLARAHPDIRNEKDFLQTLRDRQKDWESQANNTCQTR